MKKSMNLTLRMESTMADVRLLKKIFKYYINTAASESEKAHIDVYMRLIDYQVKKQKKKRKKRCKIETINY